MNWIFLAILAPFLYAVSVFIDKYLISSKVADYRGLPIFGFFISLPAFLLLALFNGFNGLQTKDALLVILTGISTIIAFSLYLEALVKEDTSIIIILFQLIPLMVLVFSYYILGETLTFKQLVGFGLLLTASIIISLKRDSSSFKLSKAFLYILLADILWALPYILIKFASEGISFSNLIMYESAGVVVGSFFLFFLASSVRNAFLKIIKKVRKPTLGIILFNESLYLFAKIVTYLAVTLGSAVVVSVLGSTQIFFGILLGIFMTLLLPKIFKEDLSKVGIIKKSVLGLMAFIGIILVS